MRWSATLLVIALAGCGEREAAMATPSPADAPGASAAPAAAATIGAAATADAGDSSSGHDQRVVNFGGYASARFNDGPDAVRRAFAGPLDAAPAPDDPTACHYLMSAPRSPQGFGIAFMIEGGKFVRYDVDTQAIIAPGGLAVGQRATAVHAAFGELVQVQPHKYVEGGQVLVVRPADGGEARLIFETDAAGGITSWRIGIEPQVHYVEGCS